MNGGAVVTGSSGFIGMHLCELLAASGADGALTGIDLLPPRPSTPRYRAALADITMPERLRAAVPDPVNTVFHLAAKAEVVIPFEDLPELNTTNVNGTINVLAAFAPTRLIFASSSAVYGNGAKPSVDTDWRQVNPVGAYGMTKAAGELVCADWARQTGGSAVSFRLGNVTGRGCRGLIPFLVRHALLYPDGAVPARIRGEGRVVRDYVPVSYVVELFRRAGDRPWLAGRAVAFNIGTGRPSTNGEIAAIVADALRRAGYCLRVEPSLPLEPGEASYVALDMTDTERVFDAPVPTVEEVRAAVREAVTACLEAGGS